MQGFLLLNKPSGITSFGAVSRIKKLCHEKRVGHTGTLDPMACGVLPIFIGRATALSSYLSDADKTYIATVKLGVVTDTLDITGNILKTENVSVTNDDILSVLEKFKGKILQTPPMFSAIKKDGVRMYELARKGETADIPEREVTVHSIRLTKPLTDNEFQIETTVSKGTYIRSLCSDIGKMLGCGATLTSLCRTFASGFSIDACVNLDCLNEENIEKYITSEENAVSHFDEIYVTENQAVRFTNGGQLSFERLNKSDFLDNQIIRVKHKDTFLGLGFADNEKKEIAIKCVINKI